MSKKRKKRAQKLNQGQKAFVQHYKASGNATQAARAAGYKGSDETVAVTGSRMLKLAKVQRALAEVTKKDEDKRIATAEQIQQLWTEVLNNPKVSLGDRLKASELLAKTQGQFIKRVQNDGKVTVVVRRGDDAPAGLQRTEGDTDG
jgi:phage terminase small subunit